MLMMEVGFYQSCEANPLPVILMNLLSIFPVLSIATLGKDFNASFAFDASDIFK